MRSRPLSSLILMQHGPDMARVLIRLVSRQAGSRCRWEVTTCSPACRCSCTRPALGEYRPASLPADPQLSLPPPYFWPLDNRGWGVEREVSVGLATPSSLLCHSLGCMCLGWYVVYDSVRQCLVGVGPVAGLTRLTSSSSRVGGVGSHSVGGVSREGKVQRAPVGPHGRQQPSSTHLRPLRVSLGRPTYLGWIIQTYL